MVQATIQFSDSPTEYEQDGTRFRITLDRNDELGDRPYVIKEVQDITAGTPLKMDSHLWRFKSTTEANDWAKKMIGIELEKRASTSK